MKAVVLEKACAPQDLYVKEVPMPKVKPGWVLVKIKPSESIVRKFIQDKGIHHL